MSFLRATLTVSSLTLASRLFGFVRDVMAAAIMGAGPVADAFIVALRLPNFFRRMTAEGAFSVSFVPLFSRTLQQDGRTAAQDFANQTMAMMLVILIPFTVLAIIFMPFLLTVLAPGFSQVGERFDLAVTLTRITFGYLLCMSLAAFVGGMLNAIDRFAPFALAPVLFNIMQILFLLVAFRFPTPGHAMAWGVLASGVLQFALLLWVLRRQGFHLKLVRPRLTERIRRLFSLMGPGMVGASAVQINLLVDTVIASTLPVGAVSYLYYADRLTQLPLGLIGTAVGTALLPKLAHEIAAQHHKGASHLFNRALEWTFVLTLPAAAALAILALPVISVLFERGAFTAQAAMATAAALQVYAFGLPAFVGIKVLSTALYAQENTRTPVRITLVCAALNIVLCLVLIRFWGHVGIALATVLAGWVQVAILTVILDRRKELLFDAQLRRNMLRILLASLAMVALLAGGRIVLAAWFDAGGFKAFLALAILVATGGGLYLLLVFWQRVLSIKTIMQSLKGQDTANEPADPQAHTLGH